MNPQKINVWIIASAILLLIIFVGNRLIASGNLRFTWSDSDLRTQSAILQNQNDGLPIMPAPPAPETCDNYGVWLPHLHFLLTLGTFNCFG